MPRRGNAEGSIYQRSDGLWAAAVSLPNGRRRVLYAKTRQEASRKLIAATRERDEDLTPAPERFTVSDFLLRWLEQVKPTLGARTWVKYEQVVRLHVLPYIGRTRLNRLRPDDLQLLYAKVLEKGAAPQSVKHVHRVLHRALSQAHRWGLVSRNVASLVDGPKVKRRPMRSLSPEEARRFLEAAEGDHHEALYVLALTSGMRQGELLSLQWEDVDLENATIHIQQSKTDSGRRQVVLLEIAMKALRSHKVRQAEDRLALGSLWRDNGLVFANEVGNAINPSNLRLRSFSRLLARAGIGTIRFHDLRHTAASLLLAQGIHPKIVSELLGHSSIVITLDTYSHVLPTLQREAMAQLERVLTGK